MKYLQQPYSLVHFQYIFKVRKSELFMLNEIRPGFNLKL